MIEPHIIGHHDVIGGRNVVTLEWVGSRYGIAEVQGIYFDTVKSGLPIKVVEYDPSTREYIVARTDTFLPLYLWHILLSRLRRLHIKDRIIQTFMIWGIGYCEEGVSLNWGDLLRKKPK